MLDIVLSQWQVRMDRNGEEEDGNMEDSVDV